MTDDTRELARRAVACDGWRWMRGMADTDGRMFLEYGDCGEAAWLWTADEEPIWLPVEGRIPDLTDPATLGCLGALVREAWGDPLICTATDNTGAGWWVDGCDVPGSLYATEAAALVAALEAASAGSTKTEDEVRHD